MIGNQHDAALALNDYRTRENNYLFSIAGSSRAVFLINGVIYKVNRYDEDWNANQDEYLNFIAMGGILPSGVFIPECNLFDVNGISVLAMEYIHGRATGECSGAWTGLGCEDHNLCISDNLMAELFDLGWTDPCWGNAIRVGSDIYLVDVA